MLFQSLWAATILVYSIRITETCRDKHEFMTVLAGLCLMYTTITPIIDDPDIVKQYESMDNGLDVLRQKALAKALAHNEAESNEISATIQALNKHGSFSFYGLSKDKAAAEQRFLLLRAVIFQKWLESECRKLKPTKASVDAAMNGNTEQEPAATTTENVGPSPMPTSTPIHSLPYDKHKIIHNKKDSSFLPKKM